MQGRSKDHVRAGRCHAQLVDNVVHCSDWKVAGIPVDWGHTRSPARRCAFIISHGSVSGQATDLAMEIGGGGEHGECVLARRFGRHIVLNFHFVYSNSDSVGHFVLTFFLFGQGAGVGSAVPEMNSLESRWWTSLAASTPMLDDVQDSRDETAEGGWETEVELGTPGPKVLGCDSWKFLNGNDIAPHGAVYTTGTRAHGLTPTRRNARSWTEWTGSGRRGGACGLDTVVGQRAGSVVSHVGCRRGWSRDRSSTTAQGRTPCPA